MLGFRTARSSLGDLDAEVAAAVIAAAADVTLLMDRSGVIQDMAFRSSELAQEFEGQPSWVGQAWRDLVTEESRVKVEDIIRDSAGSSGTRWRQVNQISDRGTSVPLLCTATRLGQKDRIVVFGRDLRPDSILQQRLVDAQAAMQRDYSRLRHAEARYRLLFQMSAEPVLVVDAATLRLVEVNLAADRLFAGQEGAVTGRAFLDIFEDDSRGRVQVLLAGVQAAGRADDVIARLAGGGREVVVAASLFRHDGAMLFLVRLGATAQTGTDQQVPKSKGKLLKLIENAPDALVVIGPDSRIIATNPAFLELAQLATEEQARGEPLARWLGRTGVELDVLISHVRQRGPVRLFATTLRGEHGATADVEVSAVAVLNGGQPSFGFAIRDVGARLTPESPSRPVIPRSVDQLAELVGRVPLKDLVREATDVIERLAIEAALQITGDNRASAAEVLGLSRQSLYVKLRRYGLGDLLPENE